MCFITSHARMRASQRGVIHKVLDALVAHGDVEVAVGSGDTSITMSRGGIEEMAAEGVSRDQLDKLGRLAVVITADGAVKTVMVMRKSGRGTRRYRHGGK